MGSSDDVCWWRTGFEPELLTDKQYAVILARFRDVGFAMSQEERCMFELVGADEWIDGLTKVEASKIISFVLDKEKLQRAKDAADGTSGDITVSEVVSGVCPSCKEKMSSRDWGFHCVRCKKNTFVVSGLKVT